MPRRREREDGLHTQAYVYDVLGTQAEGRGIIYNIAGRHRVRFLVGNNEVEATVINDKLEVRCIEGALMVEPHSANVVHITGGHRG